MKFGDEVKRHIDNGKNETFIRNFLSKVSLVANQREQEKSHVVESEKY